MKKGYKFQRGFSGIIAIFIIVTIIVAGYVLFFSKNQLTTHHEEGWESITFGLALQPTDALVMIALEKDFFLAEKLQVVTELYPSGKRALREGLFAGKVDLASSTEVPITFGGLNQRDFKIIATIYNANNVNRVIARRDSGISQPSDLREKNVGTQKSSAVHFFLHLFLQHHELSQHDIQSSFLKAEELPEALASGTIDAFSMREPYISKAKHLLGNNAIIFSEPGLYNQMEVVVASNAIIQDKPELIDRFIKALLRAEGFARTNPEEAIIITAKWLGVESGIIQQLWPTVQFKISMEQSLLTTLTEEANWAIEEGYVTTKTVPNFREYFYLKSLKRIKPEVVSIE